MNNVNEPILNKLKHKNVAELVALFKTLEAPDFSEMNGEYDATLLDFGGTFKNLIGYLCCHIIPSNGRWLGKAFNPGETQIGNGYNFFYRYQKVIRKYRMSTKISNSRYDGEPIFELNYSDYPSLLGKINMVDEVRKIDDGVYLGLGTSGFSKKQRMMPLPFCLIGPSAQVDLNCSN